MSEDFLGLFYELPKRLIDHLKRISWEVDDSTCTNGCLRGKSQLEDSLRRRTIMTRVYRENAVNAGLTVGRVVVAFKIWAQRIGL